MNTVIKQIVDALTSADSATVAVGAIAMPIAVLVREIASKSKKLAKWLTGWKVLGMVVVISTGLCYVWSRMPGVEMAFSWASVLTAAASAVFLRQGIKHTNLADK